MVSKTLSNKRKKCDRCRNPRTRPGPRLNSQPQGATKPGGALKTEKLEEVEGMGQCRPKLRGKFCLSRCPHPGIFEVLCDLEKIFPNFPRQCPRNSPGKPPEKTPERATAFSSFLLEGCN